MVYGLTPYIREYFTREYFNTTVPSNREFKNAKNAKIPNPRNINPTKSKAHTVSATVKRREEHPLPSSSGNGPSFVSSATLKYASRTGSTWALIT